MKNKADNNAEINAETNINRFRLREGILLTIALFTIALVAAFLSYSPEDPGYTFTGAISDEVKINNAIGRVGAWFASVNFLLFGYLAYLVPAITLLYTARLFYRSKEPVWPEWPTFIIRCIGFVLVMVGTTGLVHLSVQVTEPHLPEGAGVGGILGKVIGDHVSAALNVFGARLLLLGLSLFGITIVTDFSWVMLAEQIGKQVYNLVYLLTSSGRQKIAEQAAALAERKEARSIESEDDENTDSQAEETEDSSIDIVVAGKVVDEESKPAGKGNKLANMFRKNKTAEQEVLAEPSANGRVEPTIGKIESTAEDDAGLEPTMEQQQKPNQTGDQTAQSNQSTSVAPVQATANGAEDSANDDAPTIAPMSKEVAGTATDNSPKPAKKVRKGKLFDAPVTGSLPPISLLDKAVKSEKSYSAEQLQQMGKLLESKLLEFSVKAQVKAIYPGPVITRFEIEPAPGTKASKISGLATDLARSLAVISVRVVEVIPGKPYIGVEIPNEDREIVMFSEVVGARVFKKAESPLTIGLGHDISGEAVIADIAKMPHLLVAGTTGSGKSVGVNSMLLSMLFKATPQEVRFILIDPKMLELAVYEGIPHLLTPVITDMKDAANSLRWAVAEMERRYKLMAQLGVRNLKGFNEMVNEANKKGQPIPDPLWNPGQEFEAGEDVPPAPGLDALPSIVIVIDEFADMMMVVGKKVEELIARIAQKARAAGIHLILATQRPSVDVITGLIKANVPTRMSFKVSTKTDSRTILDQGGAEQLLGHGDMLYQPPGSNVPIRVHGAFVDDHEVHAVVANWKKRGEPCYIEGLIDEGHTDNVPGFEGDKQANGGDAESDPLYDEAVFFVTQSRRASISAVQRKLRVGYNRAARLIEDMEMAGIVTEMGSNGQREVLAPPPAE